jgi:antirestriction protein ArdC
MRACFSPDEKKAAQRGGLCLDTSHNGYIYSLEHVAIVARFMESNVRNLQKEITERIIAQLRAGVVPWRKPWSTRASGTIDGAPVLFPRNAVTGRAYSGINILLLWGKIDDCGFSDARFLTFKQAKELGGTVRKGEKGTEVVYVNFVERESRANPEETVRIPFLKSYYVFNLAQCDGLPAKLVDAGNVIDRPPVKLNERDATIDDFVLSTGARIQHGEPRAFYTTAGDFVNMPIFQSFMSSHRYYATLFHELGHWTGAAARLNRTFGRRFGDRAYAAEELVAELASAFTCAEFGIDNDGQDAAYIATWLERLEANDGLLIAAASAASKAVEYMRALAIAAPVLAPALELEAA